MHKKRHKRSITLVEMMVVITLIGIIGGALAFNMRGSIQKGKVFQTEQKCARVYDILMMEYATGNMSLEEIISRKDSIILSAAWNRDGKKLLEDAWGNELIVSLNERGDDILVYSKKIQNPTH